MRLVGDVGEDLGAKKWFLETRPQFLILSIVLVMHGSALAFSQPENTFGWLKFVLALVGLVLLHAASNVLNDWHDMKTGIDLNVKRTPFSGGSGLLPAGALTQGQALGLGIGTLAAGSAIGFYLAYISGWPLLVIGLTGAVTIAIYTPFLLHIYMGEIFAGLGLGLFPVVGVYYLMTGRLDAVAWVSGIPAFCLTYNLLFLNEFPDTEADKAGGRRHMVILLGKKNARWLYVAMELATYAAIVAGVVAGVIKTPWALLGLVALVPALGAIRGAIANYDKHDELIPSLGQNVMAVLGTNALMAIGYLIAGLTAK
jgi:1,4-dihydroxy-2-naphthoate octaprenyltransferase